MLMLISVHLPKTAGLSFAAALKEYFGYPAFLNDYNDWPINTPPMKRKFQALKHFFFDKPSDYNGIDCIHGHFLPLKYAGLQRKMEMKFVTWMRDPVQRVISHYHYWKRSYDPVKSPVLHRRMVEEEWSLERFCLGREVQNIYKTFLWGFPLKKFDFIGISEFFKEDLAWFGRHMLDINIKPRRENVGNHNGEPYRLDPLLERKITDHHKVDYEIYRFALRLRKKRMGKDN
jgi:hypothetical protein